MNNSTYEPHNSAAGTDPWTRQPDETEEAFEAFQIFRDLEGRDRSLGQVKLQLQARELERAGRSVFQADLQDDMSTADADKSLTARLRQWFRTHRWAERVKEWDDLLAQRIAAKRLDEVEKMSKQHAQQAAAACAILALTSQEVLTAVKSVKSKTGKPRSTKQKLRFLKIGADVNRNLPKLHAAERIARGVRVQLSDKDGLGQGVNIIWELVVDTPPPGHVYPNANDFLKRSGSDGGIELPSEPEEPDDPNLDRADPIRKFGA